MPEKSKKTDRKASPREAKRAEPKKAPAAVDKKQAPKKGMSQAKTLAIVVILVAALLLLFFFVVLPSQLNVPFTTFKANLASAPRVVVILGYSNQSQFVSESQCATQVVQVMAHSRNATTIDFYVINSTLCTYPKGGLGHTISVANATPSECMAMVGSEPTVFLNYSASNYSVVTAYKLHVYGNAQFMAACPLAVDLS